MKRLLSLFALLSVSNALYANNFGDYDDLSVLSLEKAKQVFQTEVGHNCFLNRRGVFFRTGKWRPAPQCFERAQVWSYALQEQQHVNSFKYFLFFSKYYRTACKYKWKFHVTPAVMVKQADGQVIPMTMDRAFSDGPEELYSWTKMFIHENKREEDCHVAADDYKCKVIDLRDYQGYDYPAYHRKANGAPTMCFIVKVPRHAFYIRELEPQFQHEIGSSFRMNTVKRSFNLLKSRCQKRLESEPWYIDLDLKKRKSELSSSDSGDFWSNL